MRLLTNVILASARRSDLAPALSRSEKWSSATAITLLASQHSLPLSAQSPGMA